MTDPFSGKIDEVRVWSKVKTEADINDQMCRPLVGDEAELQGYWPMEGDALDYSGNGSDGTAGGDAGFTPIVR